MTNQATLIAPQAKEFVEALSPDELIRLKYDWDFWARPNQREPDTDWLVWLLRSGRGYGKTRTGAETVRSYVESGRARNIALVAPTAADARDIMIDDDESDDSGLLPISPPWCKPTWQAAKRRLVWPNGAIATVYSAEDPDQLRGPQHDLAWCDELAAWPRLNIQKVWDNLMFGLRKGVSRVIVTTTPRPIPLLRQLIKREGTVDVKASTYENLHNLSRTYIEQIIKPYEGTRLGRQELEGDILDDNPDALWTYAMLDASRVDIAPFEFTRVEVAVDPAGSPDGHEVGIIAAGLGRDDKHGYVLGDYSFNGTPDQWAERAIDAYDLHRADCVTVERNYGGDMVAAVLRLKAQAMHHRPVPVKQVVATRGKAVRAEPVSGLYQQGRVHHVGSFPKLEDQLCDFISGGSNDRVDAVVWAITSLMSGMFAKFRPVDTNKIEAVLNTQPNSRERDKRPRTELGNIWRKVF